MPRWLTAALADWTTMTDSILTRTRALHTLAAARGVTPGAGCDCVVCGASPYDVGRPAGGLLGPGFTDFDALRSPHSEHACEGCCSILGGKPGSVPMPLRMGHFAVVDGELLRPSGEELLALLVDPPAGLTVIAWTATRKRHASLRCGPCADGLLMVGAEQGTIAWDVAEGRALVHAATTLRQHARTEHVATGQYPPHVILALGAAWEPAEAVVARYRPSLTLDMVVALVRRPDTLTTTEEASVPISEIHRRAGSLLLAIGRASADRDADAIAFWATLFPRRVAAAADRPTLIRAVGWLTQAVRCNPSQLVEVVAEVESMTGAEADEILSVWREQTLLSIAFARQISRDRYEESA